MPLDRVLGQPFSALVSQIDRGGVRLSVRLPVLGSSLPALSFR